MILDYIPQQIPIGRAKDLTNQKFGKLTVLYRIKSPSKGKAAWYCKCECGNYTQVLSQGLLNKTTLSCGCWNKERDRSYRHGPKKDMSNQIINGFKVIEQDTSAPAKNGKGIRWLVECPFCKRIFSIDGRNLRYGNQKSCGCVKSFGEYTINKILLENNINFKTQYIFKDLPNRKFDFAIFNDNNELQYLIEYDGQQHFDKNSRYYSEEGAKRDLQKNNFCLKNNIKLYRIPYTEKENLSFQRITNSIFLIQKEKNKNE